MQSSFLSSSAEPVSCCREAVFDAVIDETVHPSEKMPLRHLAIEEFADHLFQLGETVALLLSCTTTAGY